MKNYIVNQKGIAPIVIILIIVGVLILVGGGIWYWQQQKEEAVEEPVVEELTVKDCGAVGPENPGDEEKVKGCFESKFKDCKPAQMVMSIDMGSSGGLITYYYEIIGPDNNLCKVKSKFLKNPNPDWINKEMVCNYDNSKNFYEVIQDFIGKCSGPLYELMTKGMQIPSNSSCALKTNVTKIELLKGVSSSIIASGFKGLEDQVSWVVKDTNIATVSPLSGKTVMLKSVNRGSMQLLVTDNAVGSDCFVSVSITVK